MKKVLIIAVLLAISKLLFALDLDGNGIQDEVEQGLADRFKPCMILPLCDQGVAPEPVDIMGVKRVCRVIKYDGSIRYVPNLWLTFYDINGNNVGTEHFSNVYPYTQCGNGYAYFEHVGINTINGSFGNMRDG